MKNTLISCTLCLHLAVVVNAGDDLEPATVSKTVAAYNEKIQKAQDEYVEAMRVLLSDVTSIELLLLEAGKRPQEPNLFDDDWGTPRFAAPFSEQSYKILDKARVENAADVSDFISAVLPKEDLAVVGLPEYPGFGFRCFVGTSQVFAGTIDLASQSTEINFPDGQSKQLGMQIEKLRKLLTAKNLLDTTKPNKSEMATPRKPSD